MGTLSRLFLILLCLIASFLSGCGESGDDDGGSSESDDDDDSADDDSTDDDDDDLVECDENHPDWTVGMVYCTKESTNGYTLFSPSGSTATYLIDIFGRLINSWDSDYIPGEAVYLLEDGSLLRTTDQQSQHFTSGGKGGGIERRTWEGELIWDFKFVNDDHCPHHDIELLPNGNVLLIVWEIKDEEEALDAGRDPNIPVDGEIWVDYLVEIEPDGLTGGNIIWEWHVWDHLVQDVDETKDNYGIVEERAELININFSPSSMGDWTHINAVDYNQEYDQIILSVHSFSEIWIIDHSTTTSQAAGHSGGNYGKGGDLLYRWGNPMAYRAGEPEEQIFVSQHDAEWIPDGYPGAGNLIVFNNEGGGDYSSIDEWTPPVDANGVYDFTAGQPYGPDTLAWTWVAETPTDFYSPGQSGVQRLQSGNTLICEASKGKLFEVTPDGDIVWIYINPVVNNQAVNQGDPVPTIETFEGATNNIFRTRRYPPDYPAFDGRDMSPGDYLEGN